jgi:hypothetical protein
MPERTIDALLDGAVPLGTTSGVGYLRVGVVLARDEASGTLLGIYATEQQWGETTAAALIERETDNGRLRAALADQELETRSRPWNWSGCAHSSRRCRRPSCQHLSRLVRPRRRQRCARRSLAQTPSAKRRGKLGRHWGATVRLPMGRR